MISEHARRRVAGRILLAATASLVVVSTSAAKLETWRQDSASAFAKGKKEHVVISDGGRVRLGRQVSALGPIDASHVWDLARTKAGVLYAATGNSGKVYRREGDGPWTVASDSEDSQALCVVAMPDGRAFAGTGPSGSVVEVTDPKAKPERPDPAIKYVWDLAADADGTLFAATGPTGQVWKRDKAGKWSLVLDSKNPHILCLAVGPDGSLYAGSDGEGLIYRVAPGGKVSVLYDAPQSEVHSLLLAPDGFLYAGTAADAGGGGSGGGPGGSGRGFAVGSIDGVAGGSAPILAAALQNPPPRPPREGDPSTAIPPGGTATPRPGPPGENAVYRIGPDGTPREIFKARALIYALALNGDSLLVGTGPEGQLYEVRDSGREFSSIARLDHGQILALLTGDQGEVLLGTGDPGAVLRLNSGYLKAGSMTSDVHDAKLVSRFGAVSWRADLPAKTSISVQVRSGNVGDPDGTWSEWSAPLTDPAGGRPSVPPGRFAQYRALLQSDDPAISPELRSIALVYQTTNLPPELSRVVVPDVTAADGATRQTKLAVRWDATDPNDDDLVYTLHIRKDGWPDWVKLTETPLTDKTYAWDVTAVPAGMYRLRVTASDRPSNPPDASLTRELTSEAFVVDHQSPSVTVLPTAKGAKIVLKDDLTRLVKAAYALDGGDWVAIFPDDGLFDTSGETITVLLPDLRPGTHVLMIRATDAAGNVGSGDGVLKVPDVRNAGR